MLHVDHTPRLAYRARSRQLALTVGVAERAKILYL
jgi:hypothetical protein